jgi:hypothetical protein
MANLVSRRDRTRVSGVSSVLDEAAGFPPSTSVFPCQYYSISAQHSSSCNVSDQNLQKSNAILENRGALHRRLLFV